MNRNTTTMLPNRPPTLLLQRDPLSIIHPTIHRTRSTNTRLPLLRIIINNSTEITSIAQTMFWIVVVVVVVDSGGSSPARCTGVGSAAGVEVVVEIAWAVVVAGCSGWGFPPAEEGVHGADVGGYEADVGF
jgi:hypothetical protein